VDYPEINVQKSPSHGYYQRSSSNRNSFEWVLEDKFSIESLLMGIKGDEGSVETH
jgi:hypothetical protein